MLMLWNVLSCVYINIFIQICNILLNQTRRKWSVWWLMNDRRSTSLPAAAGCVCLWRVRMRTRSWSEWRRRCCCPKRTCCGRARARRDIASALRVSNSHAHKQWETQNGYCWSSNNTILIVSGIFLFLFFAIVCTASSHHTRKPFIAHIMPRQPHAVQSYYCTPTKYLQSINNDWSGYHCVCRIRHKFSIRCLTTHFSFFCTILFFCNW